MKNYKAPELKVEALEAEEIISTSPWVETTMRDENDGIWDLNTDT